MQIRSATLQRVPQFERVSLKLLASQLRKLKIKCVPFICRPDEPGVYSSVLAVREFEREGAF